MCARQGALFHFQRLSRAHFPMLGLLSGLGSVDSGQWLRVVSQDQVLRLIRTENRRTLGMGFNRPGLGSTFGSRFPNGSLLDSVADSQFSSLF